MDFMEQFAACVPDSPKAEIAWNRIEPLLPSAWVSGMKAAPQEPSYHGEGDVYTHTRMVCRELTEMPAFYELPERQRRELFLAAVLHDVGKVKTTRLDDGHWVSLRHSSTGSQMVRTLLWRDWGVCGAREWIVFRETVCALIRFHMLPVHLMERDRPEWRARQAAAVGELAADFSWRLLCMLSEADIRGRIAEDRGEGLAWVELAGMMAEESGCLNGPYRFCDSFTKRAYLSGRNVRPDQPLYDDTWGEVIMLSGLPGTGKDTWIRRNHPDMPVVSLDGFRAELAIRPTEDQGEVIQAAKERAREYLRKKQPFLWNATDLTRDTRQKLVGLFERYGARARIVYLETDRETREARNRGRAGAVPEDAVARMLGKSVLPTPEEAQTVEWLCV